MIKKISILSVALLIAFIAFRSNFEITKKTASDIPELEQTTQNKEITGVINKGETLFDIFKKYNLDFAELFKIKEASANIHRVRNLHPGQPYKIILDQDNQVCSLTYWINDEAILNVNRNETGFCAEKQSIEYEKIYKNISGTIDNNLVSSIGDDNSGLLLALQLSDIFAWDIDFTSDLRKGDTYKIVVEALYLDGEFKKYGDILSAEFINDNRSYYAFGFFSNGKINYYDAEGRSLKKAFLKAPLSFRRISSNFSKGRLHPILKIYRPHHGLDYAAAAGTPVSSVADGKIIFKGYKGQYGNLVIVKHKNGWHTYYGHLSKFAKGIKAGNSLDQGDLIGYVGSTGLATGPHLHYEIRINNKPVNPLTLKLPDGSPVPSALMADFSKFRNSMMLKLEAINVETFDYAKK
ncbi:MAG: peptidoglycan DD-metalloendopeptidase family protein [Dissulfurispiraceae bacterium]|jgi:murein DD-endopeptidase MepM/ murein hydrolase activator NlpD|nr:peptidoglycan DD-metalloendopeptidase family protein [Dissulfurispiraceae bacterium]